MAPIASCPPPRLASKDAGAGEARYEDAVDTRPYKLEIDGMTVKKLSSYLKKHWPEILE
jgi:hypothetical protein